MSTCTHTSRHISWGQLCSIFSMCELTNLQQRVCVWREHVPSCRYLCLMIMCFEGAPCFLNWCLPGWRFSKLPTIHRFSKQAEGEEADHSKRWGDVMVFKGSREHYFTWQHWNVYSYVCEWITHTSAFSKYVQDYVHVCAIRPCMFSLCDPE